MLLEGFTLKHNRSAPWRQKLLSLFKKQEAPKEVSDKRKFLRLLGLAAIGTSLTQSRSEAATWQALGGGGEMYSVASETVRDSNPSGISHFYDYYNGSMYSEAKPLFTAPFTGTLRITFKMTRSYSGSGAVYFYCFDSNVRLGYASKYFNSNSEEYWFSLDLKVIAGCSYYATLSSSTGNTSTSISSISIKFDLTSVAPTSFNVIYNE